MDYTNETLGVSFTLPDSITVRKQLSYRNAIINTTNTLDLYIRFWQGFLVLVENWQCKTLPDANAVDLDTDTRPATADIVVWACNICARHMGELENVPKN